MAVLLMWAVSSPARVAVIAIDEAHGNFHTGDGRYAPLAELLRERGERVVAHADTFAAGTLAGCDLLVIANALAAANRDGGTRPTSSAFTAAEIEAVHGWVRGGGGLLLIADHMPFPGAAADLAARFGVDMANGFAFGPDGPGPLWFRRDDDSLADHAITGARNGDDGVPFVVSFDGQAFTLSDTVAAWPLLRLPHGSVLLYPERVWQFDAETPRRDASGWLQGVVREVGAGRVAVFGEAAMFTSQSVGDGPPPGFEHPEAPWNRRFILRVVDWLLGRMPAG